MLFLNETLKRVPVMCSMHINAELRKVGKKKVSDDQIRDIVKDFPKGTVKDVLLKAGFEPERVEDLLED